MTVPVTLYEQTNKAVPVTLYEETDMALAVTFPPPCYDSIKCCKITKIIKVLKDKENKLTETDGRSIFTYYNFFLSDGDTDFEVNESFSFPCRTP
jgi:hypothetical protein